MTVGKGLAIIHSVAYQTTIFRNTGILFQALRKLTFNDFEKQLTSSSFGTWKIGNGQGPIDQVDQALSVGFSHIGEWFSRRTISEPVY